MFLLHHYHFCAKSFYLSQVSWHVEMFCSKWYFCCVQDVVIEIYRYIDKTDSLYSYHICFLEVQWYYSGCVFICTYNLYPWQQYWLKQGGFALHCSLHTCFAHLSTKFSRVRYYRSWVSVILIELNHWMRSSK